MWQVAAVSASPPRPRMSPPGSSVWHCANAGSGRRELHRCSSLQVCTHTHTQTHTPKDTQTKMRVHTVAGSHVHISRWRQTKSWGRGTKIHTHTQPAKSTLLHSHPTPWHSVVRSCSPIKLKSVTQITAEDCMRRALLGPDTHTHMHRCTHTTAAHLYTHTLCYSTDKEQVNMMTLVNNSRENWEWKREHREWTQRIERYGWDIYIHEYI